MKYLLDTNTLIYLIKHRPPAVAERVSRLADEDQLCMSFVSFAELLKGAEGSSRKTEVRQRLDGLIRQVPVLYATGRTVCEHCALQAHRLKTAGTPIGGNDLWIASHALAEDATLVTHNTREFERIAGLRLADWTS